MNLTIFKSTIDMNTCSEYLDFVADFILFTLKRRKPVMSTIAITNIITPTTSIGRDSGAMLFPAGIINKVFIIETVIAHVILFNLSL